MIIISFGYTENKKNQSKNYNKNIFGNAPDIRSLILCETNSIVLPCLFW